MACVIFISCLFFLPFYPSYCIDAIIDINNLRAYVTEKYGEPKFSVLEGESMGGHIVCLVAERHSELYQGVFSVGAALCPTKQVRFIKMYAFRH
jgi:pimeloyl-ACP methyl ester carboxylesterase